MTSTRGLNACHSPPSITSRSYPSTSILRKSTVTSPSASVISASVVIGTVMVEGTMPKVAANRSSSSSWQDERPVSPHSWKVTLPTAVPTATLRLVSRVRCSTNLRWKRATGSMFTPDQPLS